MKVVGHRFAQGYLSRCLPRCTLLLGPSSIGKRTLVEAVRQHWQIADSDHWAVEKLSAEVARELGAWALRLPTRGPVRLATADLSGVGASGWAPLLKTLEEAPASTRFLLRSSEPVASTILGRSMPFPLGLLSTSDVMEILVLRGMAVDVAKNLSLRSGGQVERALAFESKNFQRSVARTIVRSFVDGDERLFRTAIVDLDEATLGCLRTLVLEATTGRWLEFSPSDLGQLTDQKSLRRMMIGLNRDVRPKLLVKQLWNEMIVR